MNKKTIAISLPTGIGVDIGGYAGDFGHIAREFAKYFYTIINPNAVNGGILSAINYDMAYLEGYLFDEFFKGTIGINPKKPYETNKIGVIFDCEIPQNIINIHINSINALKMVQGINIEDIVYTQKPAGVEIVIENKISSGNLKKPDTILEAAEKLIKKGVEAIAVVCFFGDDISDTDYSNANGIDPVGGVEAIISHLISKEFLIPSAHSPAFSNVEISEKIENPKVSSELISSTFFPCIAQGLSIAPAVKKREEAYISIDNIEYLIVPYDALGSSAVLSSYEKGVKILTVKNKSSLDVTCDKLNIKPYEHFESYEKCLKKIIKNLI